MLVKGGPGVSGMSSKNVIWIVFCLNAPIFPHSPIVIVNGIIKIEGIKWFDLIIHATWQVILFITHGGNTAVH